MTRTERYWTVTDPGPNGLPIVAPLYFSRAEALRAKARITGGDSCRVVRATVKYDDGKRKGKSWERRKAGRPNDT
jgi:hypothetical protein